MNVKVNFAQADSSLPNNYILDSGQGYSLDRGFGWITEASIGSEVATPLDLTPNTRDRDIVSDQRSDSLIHLQYREDVFRPDAVTTPGAWEYDLSDGSYRVTVSVGDPVFLDSRHVINIEGNEFITGFTPATNDKFEVVTKVVEVNDGKLTLDALGGFNTKLNFVEIASVTSAKINFGTEDSLIPEGFIADIGRGFDSARGYGWVLRESRSTPLDVTVNARTRGHSSDPTLDSLIHTDYPTGVYNPSAERAPVSWEYELPNGQYEVTVSVGDGVYTDSIHVINVEGINLIDSFIPTTETRFALGTQIVEVNDGRLTIDSIGGENTKINFVTIESVVTENSDSAF